MQNGCANTGGLFVASERVIVEITAVVDTGSLKLGSPLDNISLAYKRTRSNRSIIYSLFRSFVCLFVHSLPFHTDHHGRHLVCRPDQLVWTSFHCLSLYLQREKRHKERQKERYRPTKTLTETGTHRERQTQTEKEKETEQDGLFNGKEGREKCVVPDLFPPSPQIYIIQDSFG